MTNGQAIRNFIQSLARANLIGTDFDDGQALEVSSRDFAQQPDGSGVHIAFSISWHALGKCDETAHEALKTLGIGESDID